LKLKNFLYELLKISDALFLDILVDAICKTIKSAYLIRDHGLYLFSFENIVPICARGGVSGVASFDTIDDQLKKNRG